MKYVLPCLFALGILSVAGAPVARAEEASLYRIKNVQRIAPVFSGVPVSGQFRERDGYWFLVFYAPNRELTLAKAIADSNDWEFAKLGELVAFDGHNDAAFLFDRDGYIHLSANMHANPLNYWRSTKPLDIQSMERIDRMTGEKEDEVTYPGFFYGPEGELRFQCRAGFSGKGMRLVNVYDEKTKTWRRASANDDSSEAAEAAPLLDGSPKSNAYQSGPNLGPDGFYHLVWCWRDHFRAETNHDVGYARSKDLDHWTDSQGNALQLPITPENYERAVEIPIMSGYMGKGAGFDSQNRVILTYLCFDRDGNSQVFAARHEDGAWKNYRLTDWNKRWDFSGGGAVHFPISYSPLIVKEEGVLFSRMRNESVYGHNGTYEFYFDEDTLAPLSAPVRVYPAELTAPPASDVPLRVYLQGPPEHMVRWFTRTSAHVENEAFAARAPQDMWLEMVELERNPDPEPGPYIPLKDRHESWREVMETLDASASPELEEAAKRYDDGDFKGAYESFRAHWQKRVEQIKADPDATPRWEDWLDTPSSRIVAEYIKHRYDFAGIHRSLPYDVQYWWPFDEALTDHWHGLNHTSNTTAPISFGELQQISPVARWFNELNRLKHLGALGQAYSARPEEAVGRFWAHDFYDWMYDNPVPDSVKHIGPWAFDVAADRFCDALMPAMYQFAEADHVRDEEYFGLIRAVSEHTRYMVAALQETTALPFEQEEAAEMLHWWAMLFPEFKHSKALGDAAMETMLSFVEDTPES